MLAATLLAAVAALPLGVWPSKTGAAAVTVHEVEFYLVEPEDDYSILAIQPLATPLARAEASAVGRLAALADRLGADAVVLLGEMPETAIPDDPDTPLPTTGRYTMAVFVAFDQAEGWEHKPGVPSAMHRLTRPHHGHRHARTASVGP